MAFTCPQCGRTSPGAGHCTDDGARLLESASDPLLGQLVGSHRIARLIGEGGMGRVYLGVHPEIGSRVAIKLLSYDGAHRPGMVERFFAEARAVNVIRHEGIVNVIDLGHLSDGRPYIVMEYLDGAPLSRVLEDQRPLPVGSFLMLMMQVLDALQAAHDAGITHRDLKPDNIFVTRAGRAKILDFGIAKLRPDLAALSDHTATGALLGTPFYMSPEQARGERVDHRSDVYAAGIILYEGCAGGRPFEATALYELLRQHIEVLPPPLRAARPDLPAALESAVARALEKHPQHRFASAQELARAINQCLSFLPQEAFNPLVAEPSDTLSPALRSPAALPPTTGGTALASPPKKKASSLWWIVGLALGGLVLVAAVIVVVAGAGAVYYTASPAAPPSPTGGSTTPSAPNAPPTEGIDFTRVTPTQMMDAALKAARKDFPDAELTTITIDAPNRDGTVDISDEGTIVYAFRSPKAGSSADPLTGLGQCTLWVSVSTTGLTASRPPMGNCNVSSVRAPRCTLKQVLDRAIRSDTKLEDLTITYGGAGSPSWVFLDDDVPRYFPDDC